MSRPPRALALLILLATTAGCAPESQPATPQAGAVITTAPVAPPLPVAPSFLSGPPPLPPPTASTATSQAPVPAGWVNFGGIVLPAIPGVTTPAVGASSPPPAPAGWVTIGGIVVPAIPGITAPLANNASPTSGPSTSPPGKCGSVMVGGHRVPVDCLTPSYGEIPWASLLTLTRGALSSGKGFVGAAPLPTTVDHRADGSEGPIRDQLEVGACTAFSLAAAIDHAAARLNKGIAPVSVMHAWSHYHEPTMEDAAAGNRERGLTSEAGWQYDEKLACSWDCQDSCHDDLRVGCAAPDPVIVGAADSKTAVTLSNVTKIAPPDLDSIKDALAKGQDVWFGMRVDPEAWSDAKVRGANAVVPDGNFQSGAGHAMLLAGYAVQTNGTYYLIHNSWGASWGDGGYAWIHETTLKNNILSAYIIDVSPAAGGLPPSKPTPPAAACPTGAQPDSVTGSCASACPDGSPRAANACPVVNQCPPGYVNLSGKCVVAAPVITGQDPKTGITYACSSGGCAYVIPFGQASCAAPLCAKSCPAPKFHLTVAAAGTACSE